MNDWTTHEFAGTCLRCGWKLIVPWPLPITAPLDTVPPQVHKCPECGELVVTAVREIR